MNFGMEKLQATLPFMNKCTNQHVEGVDPDCMDNSLQRLQVSLEEQKSIVQKFDRHLLPLLCVLYILSYLDRGNIGNAKIAGLQESLHLNDSDWSWVLNSFYLCYTVFEWTNLLWRLFPAHYYVAVLCICWGAAAMCSGAVHYLGELIVCRCLLGIFEASFGAGAPYFLSLFYQRHELGLRVSVLLGMSPIANCFASALAYGITQIRKGLEPWQYLFLIEGAPTVIISIVVFFFLPDSPGSAWFLDDQQQRDAVGRLTAQDRTAKDRVHWKQVWSGLLDYKNYVHMIIHFCCNYSFAGLSNFLPTLIEDMGYVSVHAQGLTAPPYLGSFVCCLAAAFLSDRLGNRGLVVVGFSTIGLVGYLMLACVHDANADGVRYAGIWLATCGVFPSLAINITWLLNNQGGDSKRGAGMAILAIFGQCSSFVSSSLFPATDAPNYTRGCAAGAGLTGLVVVLGAVLHCKLRLENARRNRLYGRVTREHAIDVTEAGDDDPNFRYIT
ncbi:putative MFS transporter [Aspergillus niger CBS 101883]|uniref:MFS transporter n=1 Tax=Aspergillus niger ATCC 13496 TaxID=1353008 RepID=A0A370BNC3_ASPNG|nr:MFS transporter [Aspergillus niger CBS 513.88]XP_025448763.1 MFS transporter [Aspergillus niger CBS 101883]PYH50708.1 MFS transporter [Aspergillus niger CBS 101883]RDH17073.1 MFS transporter [Aspergillus niger ATCC 13496]|eukprot:XP_001395589.2 MFS transporter [Aspergillus niger CBS 513.88]